MENVFGLILIIIGNAEVRCQENLQGYVCDPRTCFSTSMSSRRASIFYFKLQPHFILTTVFKAALLSANSSRMHAAAFNAFRRTTRRPSSRRACRIFAGSRCPLPQRRNFHRSAVAYRIPDTAPTANGTENIPPEKPENGLDGSRVEEEGTEAAEASAETDNITLPARSRNGKTTSGRIRGNPPRKTEGLPPFIFPDWFIEKNIKCLGDSDLSGSLAVYGESGVQAGDGETEVNNTDAKVATEIAHQSLDISDCELSPTESAKYSVHVSVYKEILSTLRAGLALRPPKNSNQTITRPVTLLQCPKDGGSYYLDAVVETIATKLRADLIRLDAQDIAQLVGPYLDENLG
jgi:hypothetical protein